MKEQHCEVLEMPESFIRERRERGEVKGDACERDSTQLLSVRSLLLKC